MKSDTYRYRRVLTPCIYYGWLQVVHTSLKDMLPKQMRPGDPELAKPDDESIQKVTETTRDALEQLVQKKVAAAQPVRAAEKLAPAQYIR